MKQRCVGEPVVVVTRIVSVFAVAAALAQAGCAQGPYGEERSSALAVGTPVRTVHLPPSIDCSEVNVADHVAINVAAVPGGALPNRPATIPADKVLLATSCRVPDDRGATIYFIDSGPPDTAVTEVSPTDAAYTLVTKKNNILFNPPNGWGAWAFRGDRSPQDLLACANPASGSDPFQIYAIDLATGEVGNPIIEATVPNQVLFPCDGLAWDQWDDTIWFSPDLSSTVFEYGQSGALLKSIDVTPLQKPDGTACFVPGSGGVPSRGNSGISVVGEKLFLACDGEATVFEVDKKTGQQVGFFSSEALRAEDLECDSLTFHNAAVPQSVLWTKDAFEPDLLAVAVDNGSCGICREDQRKFLDEPGDPLDPTELGALLEEYIDSNVISAHETSDWHGTTSFFPGHRGYIGGFEIWLLNVKNRPDLVPLRKWNPATAIPAALLLHAGAQTTDCNNAVGSENCNPLVNTGADTSRALPAAYQYNGPSAASGGLCAHTDIFDVQSIEGSYHGGVHISIGGAFGDMKSPSAPIFFPWHAFLDDVALRFQCSCDNGAHACPACVNLFTTAPPPTPFVAGKQKPPPTPLTPIGFWWWFEEEVFQDEPSPLVVTDRSGFGHLGDVMGGAQIVPGRVGQAMRFDGRGDFVEVRDRDTGDVRDSDFTLDAWVRTSQHGFQPIVDKSDGRHAGYELFLDDGLVGLRLGATHGEDVFLADTARVDDGAWHHVAAVVKRSGLGSGLFVDGQTVLSFDPGDVAGDARSQDKLLIGRTRGSHALASSHGHRHRHHHRHAHAHPMFFKGDLDEIDLLNHALSPDEVASIFAAGTAGKYGSLGNLPTSVGRPPCLVGLGDLIAKLPAGPDATALAATYQQALTAFRNHRQRVGDQRLSTLSEQADALIEEPFRDLTLMAIARQAQQCADLKRPIVP